MKHQNILHFLANQTPQQMMSFIIETEDDKVIVIDGGTAGDAPHLLQTLREVTGSEKPVVDAWFLTHSHLDHTGALIRLLQESPDAFAIRTAYYNFPSVQFLERNESIFAEDFRSFRRAQPLLASVAETITQGDTYTVGAARFDILYTTDPAFTNNAGNNSSAVIRMTLAGQTVLFLGDLGVEGGRKLLGLYGDALKSDFVEMAHHGQNGVERDVYAAIAPRACLWCTPQWLWDNDAGKGYNTHTWQTVIVRGWMRELGVHCHFVNKDGDHHIALPCSFAPTAE